MRRFQAIAVLILNAAAIAFLLFLLFAGGDR
jgi:hypothetical protein